MTRFDAATPADRRKLYVDAIQAHREWGSPYLTVETDPPEAGTADGGEGTDPDGSGDGADPTGSGEGDAGSGGLGAAGSGPTSFEVEGDEFEVEGDEDATEAVPPWVQFGDGVVNLDCTETELDRLKDLLSEYPAFRIDELTRPEEAEGVNVRITVRADPNRTAEFLDEVFLTVFDRPEGYRAWVVEV